MKGYFQSEKDFFPTNYINYSWMENIDILSHTLLDLNNASDVEGMNEMNVLRNVDTKKKNKTKKLIQ